METDSNGNSAGCLELLRCLNYQSTILSHRVDNRSLSRWCFFLALRRSRTWTCMVICIFRRAYSAENIKKDEYSLIVDARYRNFSCVWCPAGLIFQSFSISGKAFSCAWECILFELLFSLSGYYVRIFDLFEFIFCKFVDSKDWNI